jgi:hypothetical protein
VAEPEEPAPAAPLPSPPRAAPPAKVAKSRTLSPAAKQALRRVALLLVLLAALAAAGYGIAQLVGDDGPTPAPWSQPDAPEIHPAPLTDQ